MKADDTRVISANDLLDGDVVYLDAQGGWTRALADAVVISGTDDADGRLRQAQAQTSRVVDPYLLDVTVTAQGIAPVHIRERLRDSGPSILPGLQRGAPCQACG